VNGLGAAAFAIAIASLGLAACAPAVRVAARAPRRDLLSRALAPLRSRRAAAAAGRRSLEVLQATHAALRSGLPLAPALNTEAKAMKTNGGSTKTSTRPARSRHRLSAITMTRIMPQPIPSPS